jgi:uncharacterized protein DUF4062/NACHT domain-containing protein
MYKVFLSSTARDLAEYREDVFRAICRMDGFHCVRMEDFGARDSMADAFCRQKVAECDVVVLILGLCYGSSPAGSEDSYTLQEYRAAVDMRRSRLAFMSPDNHFYPGFYRETDDLWQRQQAFRKQVAQERILDKFTTPDELASRVASALSNWVRERSTNSATQEIDSLVSFKAEVKGSDAIAQGSGATAAGAGGIAIGSVHGPVTMVNENLTAESEEHYLRTLIKRCDPLDLTPIDEAYPQAGKPGEASSVSVSEVFTTLYLARLTRSSGQEIATIIRKQGEHSPHQKTGAWEGRLPIQAIEAVAAVPCLVILGQPGGGKSTLVNYIATQLARRRLKELVAKGTLLGWHEEEKPLPVRIILRRFAAWILPDKSHGTAGLVWDYLENQLQQGGCKEVFPHLKQQLTDKGGIIFFDGLDEVRETDEETRRSLITEAISEFAAPLKKCRVLVTCREYAYKRGDAWHLLEADFPVVELDLFKDEQIAHFTQTWYQVVGPQKGWDEKKCQDEARNLRQAIQDWPHLQELAQYPLLLTLMAQVHGRDGYLPKDRADLYERAVNLLLAHWENRIVRDIHGSRQVEPGLVMQLGVRTDKLRSALERVAFTAHERQEQEQARSERAADIPKEELREELRAELESLDKAEQVIAYIQERAGLLQARDNRTYAFPHRTFQEYLAATHILKQSEFDTGRI